MKTDGSINDLVPLKTVELARDFLCFEESNFSAQVQFLGLDPKQDFQNSDLSYVDFSNSDIRGFNFSGSNMQGATGINVTWDKTTNLRDADTANSLFSYALSQEKFFKENPQHAEMVRRLNGDHWTNTVLGVESLLRADGGKGSSVKITRAIFDETTDLVVRSQILFFMRLATDTKEEHKAFIYNTIARHGGDVGVVRAGVRALRAHYMNDLDAFNVMLHLLSHGDKEIKLEALSGVMLSQHFKRALDEIREWVLQSGNSMARRAFLGRVARLEGMSYVRCVRDDAVANNYIDFANPISSRKIQLMAEQYLISRKTDRVVQSGARSDFETMEARLTVKYGEIERVAEEFDGALRWLMEKYSIPVQFTR